MAAQHRERLLAQLRHQVVMQMVPGPMADLLTDIGQLRRRRHNENTSTPFPRRPLEAIFKNAVEPAVRDAVRRSRARLRAYGDLTIECVRQPPGARAQIEGRIGKFGGFVRVSVGMNWLNRIWQRGLADVGGYMVLQVDVPAPATQLRGQAVRWDRRHAGDSVPTAAECLLFKQDGEWHLAWC
jgi:hypothetical protein